jgi:hypothetical protein
MSLQPRLSKEKKQEISDLIDTHAQRIEERSQKYKIIAKKDTHNDINRTNIDEEMKKNISLHQKWVDYLFKEKTFFTKISSEYDRIEAMIYNDLKYNSDIRDSLKNQKDYDYQLKMDSVFLKMRLNIDNQKNLTEYVKEICQILYNKNFTMKNMYEVWKADLGLMGG